MENETPIPAFGPDVAISIIPCISIRGIGPIYITDDIPFMLLPTEYMDGAISYLMDLFMTETSRLWKLILSRIGYTGSTVMLSSPYIPAGGLRTRYIIADIQFALYSSTAVAEALSA